LYIA